MNRPDDHGVREDDALRQELLELLFDCHPDPDALQARIDQEPQVRALFDETRRLAGVLNDAASDAPQDAEVSTLDASLASSLAARQDTDAGQGSSLPTQRFWTPARIAFAAIWLIALGLPFVLWLERSHRYEQTMDEGLRLVVAGDRTTPLGAVPRFSIQTWNLHGESVDADITWRLLGGHSASGRVVLAESDAAPPSTPNAPNASNAPNVPATDDALTVPPVGSDYERFLRPRWREALEAQGPDPETRQGRLNLLPMARDIEVIARTKDGAFEQRVTLPITRSRPQDFAHLTTDRALYRPGEIVRARAMALDRRSLRPTPTGNQLILQVVDPRGARSPLGYVDTSAGFAAAAWTLPENAAGGRYALELRAPTGRRSGSNTSGWLLARHPFTVLRHSPQRLQKRLDLDAESYALGERGSAELAVRRQGRSGTEALASGATVSAEVVIDGKSVWSAETELDAAGHAVMAFELPKPEAFDLRAGGGRFVARVTDGGTTETVIEPFVVPLDRLDVTFFPEGGELVAGFGGRVYAEVADAHGQPLDARGTIRDSGDQVVADFATTHQGRARFDLTPIAGERYTLVVSEPFAQRIELPRAKTGAVGLRTRTDTIAPDQPLAATIDTPTDGPWLITAFVRGQPIAQEAFTGRGRNDVSLMLPDDAAGVLRLTVFDAQLKPVAERLVQRQSKRQLRVELTAKHDVLAPGERQAIVVRTFDETGEPVPAVVGLTVADRAGRDQLDERRRIGVVDQLLLCGDVEQLDDVHEFFVDGPDAAVRIDLLLGTLGWRRFVWADPAKIAKLKEANALRAELLMVQEGRAQRPQVADVAPSLRDARRARNRAFETLGYAILISLLIGYALLAIAALRRRRAPWVRPFAIGIPAVAVLAILLTPLAIDRRADMAPMTSFAPQLSAPEEKSEDVMIGNVSDIAVGDPLLLAFGFEAQGLTQGDGTETRVVRRFDSLGRRRVMDQLGEEDRDRLRRFFDDGRDGDLRGRAENWYDRKLARAGEAPQPIPAVDPEPMDADEEEVEEVVALDELVEEAKRIEGAFDSSAWNSAIGLGGQAGYSYYRLGQARPRPPKYAHTYNNAAHDGVRRDFAETVFWQADVRTTHEATTVEFDVSDRLTTWVVTADAHQVGGTGSGRVGQAEVTFTTRKPVELDVTLPVEVSAGDRLILPLAVRVNGLDAPHADVRLETGGAIQRVPGSPLRKIALASPSTPQGPAKSGRGRVTLEVTDDKADATTVEVAVRAGRHTDAARHRLRVTPRGFPRRLDRADVARGSATIPVDLPADVRSLRAKLTLYPSPLASLRQGLQGMMREPHGCFEQTSSTNYPNVLVVSLLGLLQSDAPTLMREAKAKLAKGYQRLTGFECSNGGFDWWGKDPGHAALTAYGLLQFFDMSKVYPVDQQMIVRTQQWLLAKRDGKGSFERSADGHSFGNAPQPILDAYLCYALIATGVSATDLKLELDAIEAHALEATNRDAYELALVACALRDAGRQSSAARLRQRLAKIQEPSRDGAEPAPQLGSLIGSTSITRSGGNDLRVETTSLAVLAWLGPVTDDEPDYDSNVQSALMWLQRNRRGSGTFGGTQATVLALRALSEATLRHRSSVQSAEVRLSIGGKVVATRSLTAGTHRAIAFDRFDQFLITDGSSGNRHELQLEVGESNTIPFSLEVSYRTDRPNDSGRSPLRLQTDITDQPIEEGKSVAVAIRLGNTTDQAVHNPIAIVGLPAGLEVPPNVLDALRDAGRFAAWELNGRELVLYWRGIRPRHTVSVTVDAIAKIPGTTTGPASRAYPYYDGEAKRWSKPLRVVIEPQ